MSNPNCSYLGDFPALHPPTNQSACSAPVEGGNMTAILSECCGGTPVAQYRGIFNGDGDVNCLQYCNLSSTVANVTAETCLAGRGVCYNPWQLSTSGSQREHASQLKLGCAFLALAIMGLLVENVI